MIRRLAVLALALLPVLARPALAEDPPGLDTVTVKRQFGTSVYRIEGTVGDDPVFNVTRTVLVGGGKSGVRMLRPVSVSAKGRAPTITVQYGEEGSRTESWSEQKLEGDESPALTILRPPLTYQWCAAMLQGEKLVLGFPTGKRVRPIDEAFVHVRPFPTPGTAAEDPMHFHLWASADADLLAVLARLPGEWSPGQVGTKALSLERPEGAPKLEQKVKVTYVGTKGGQARFDFETSREGTLLRDGTWMIRRTTRGTLHVNSGSGTIESGDIECEAGWFVKERKEALVTIRHVAEIRRIDPGVELPALRNAAKEIAALFDLRRTDSAAFHERVLQGTYETAKAKVLALRPKANLDDVEVRLWDDTVDIGALTIESKQLNDSPLAMGILEEAGPPLVALGLLSKETLEELENMVPGGKAGLPWAAAFAVPSRNLLLFKSPHVADVPIMAHELAHLASDRFGYLDRDVIGLGLEEGIDPAWADLDGTLAAWALGEAEAEVVEKAVANGVTSPILLAVGLKKYLKELKPPDPNADLFRHVMHVLYEASPRVIHQVFLRGDDMEKTLARAWKLYSYQTKQILFPYLKVERSVLYPRGLALKGTGPIGATRLGSFSIQQAVARELGGTWKDADLCARALEDDVLIRFETGMLWVSRWTDMTRPERFGLMLMDKLAGQGVDASVSSSSDGTLVVQVGEVPDAEALAARLLKPVR